jgi:hypothetical protein
LRARLAAEIGGDRGYRTVQQRLGSTETTAQVGSQLQL